MNETGASAPRERDWRSFYATEASAYDCSRYGGRYGRLFEQLHHEALAALLRPHVPGPALEVAAGTGHTSMLLAAMGFALTAVDLTDAMLARGRARLREQGLAARLTLGNAFRLPFRDAAFPVVVSTRFLHLWPADDQQRLLAEMARLLRPGGVVVVDFDNRVHRDLLAGPIWLYQQAYRKRTVGEYYNHAGATVRMLEAVGLRTEALRGVGGYHLIVPALLSSRLGLALGRAHAGRPLRAIAEQFVIVARKP